MLLVFGVFAIGFIALFGIWALIFPISLSIAGIYIGFNWLATYFSDFPHWFMKLSFTEIYRRGLFFIIAFWIHVGRIEESKLFGTLK